MLEHGHPDDGQLRAEVAVYGTYLRRDTASLEVTSGVTTHGVLVIPHLVRE